MDIEKRIISLKDEEYKEFTSRIVPNVDSEKIVGVRVPLLRKLAKEILKDEGYEAFFAKIPHNTYEENNLHAFMICEIKNYDECINEVDRFLPYVDNWATCDSMRPKVFDKNTDKLMTDIKRWLASKETYTIRFAIEMIMNFYLDDNFNADYLEMVSKIHSNEYYVNMMIAWFFATALTKQYESALPYIKNNKLDQWVHNKTIQKAIESRLISDEQKIFLKALKI